MKARATALLTSTPAAILITATVIVAASIVQQLSGFRIVVFTYFLAPAITVTLGVRQGFGSLVVAIAVLATFLVFPSRLPDYIPTSELVNIKALVVALSLGLIGVVTTIATYRIRLDRLLKHISQEARIDEMTNISNRRHGNELLELELERSLRLHHPLSVILFDIDHFKAVNDRFGHQVGDAVLVDIAKLARANLRKFDTLVRWGGEEFLILLPEATTADAVQIAERLRLRIADHDFAHLQPLTISAGVAGVIDGDNSQSLMARADALLYRTKETGRNKILGGPDEGAALSRPQQQLN
jgi:diguanylate cyclase (GGDEF)-like protein